MLDWLEVVSLQEIVFVSTLIKCSSVTLINLKYIYTLSIQTVGVMINDQRQFYIYEFDP